jgi:hypothetical protein
MSKNIGWSHPNDESDQWDGFNEPGIETFAGTPIRSLAREVNQNSLDASEKGTVEVVIKLNEIDTKSIPDINELKENIDACLLASKKESKKANIFFTRAKIFLSKSKVHVLEISDFNTHGMKGPCINGSPYYAFMKAKGQSRKELETAGGSYGIGKFAPYSASNIRTIFLSTVYMDEKGKFHQYTQGKSILMSHKMDGKIKQGVGFWGQKEKCGPVEGIDTSVPNWIQRANNKKDLKSLKGSKLSILCFDPSENWEEALAISVAENFFGAICNRDLKVNINGKYKLDETTITNLFTDETIQKLAEKLDKESETFQNATAYLTALQNNPSVITEQSESTDLGLIEAKILIIEGLPKKVCFLRNGMFVSDSLVGLKNFGDFKDFVAVVQCKSTKGNLLLRGMEPPKHDDFEPDRLPTKEGQKHGARALKELSRWMRDILKRHAKDPVTDITAIDELKDYFGEEGMDGTGPGIDDINPYGEIIIRARPTAKRLNKNKTNKDDGDPGGTGEEDIIGGSGEHGGNGGSGNGQRKGGREGKKNIEVINVRAIPLGSKERIISFTPLTSGKAILSILQAGADNDYPIGVVSSSEGKITRGNISIHLSANHRYKLNIKMENEYEGAIKVVIHEI